MAVYLPTHFKGTDNLVVEALRTYGFSTVITVDDDGNPWATHVPVLFDEAKGELRFHLAAKNQHSKLIDGRRATVILHGPHTYVSSTWYENVPSGSTWNYIAVHCYGAPRRLDVSQQAKLVMDLGARFDGSLTQREVNDEYIEGLIHAFVGFEMLIENVEAKFKLSQNRVDADRRQTIAALRDRGGDADREIADWMEKFLHVEGEAQYAE